MYSVVNIQYRGHSFIAEDLAQTRSLRKYVFTLSYSVALRTDQLTQSHSQNMQISPLSKYHSLPSQRHLLRPCFGVASHTLRLDQV